MAICLVRCGLAEEQPKAWTAPVVQAVYVDTPPAIDGKLDDACWAQASRLEGFFAPDLKQAVPEETIGLICVDQRAIYVAAICKDRTPEDIKAAETRRNGAPWGDDCFEFDLDPWHQHKEVYSFLVNARGTQLEGVPGGSATKIEWRGDWTAAACRTPDGWQAEMAIPFSILRYPPGQTTFGISIWRRFARERIWAAYPVMEGQTFNPEQVADLVGLHPPPAKPRPMFMPYVTADMGDFVGRRFDTGLDVQYHMPSGLTALAALNPDFKQIEDAVESISFSYTEVWRPDFRPFFVTGQDYLPGDSMLYTRRIEDFDAGLKLFGTVGGDSYGLLDAITYGVENSLAGEWGHKLSEDADVKLRFVDHREAGSPGNSIYALNASRRWRVPKGEDGLSAGYRESFTQGADPGASCNLAGYHYRGSGELNYDWGLQLTTRDYDPALGYCYDQDSGGAYLNLNRWDHYDKGKVESEEWSVSASYRPFLHGEGIYDSNLYLRKSLKLRRGYVFTLSTGRALEYDQDSSDSGFRLGWTDNDMYRRGGAFILKGKRAGGDYTYYSLDQALRPIDYLSVIVNVEYSRLEPPSPDAYHRRQAVLTTSYDLTPEKCIAARGIWRDEGFSAYASYRQVVRRGMDAYIIVGDPDPDRTGFATRVALKLIWVF